MKILVLSDEISKSLYEYYEPGKLKNVELIIACGDLKKSYLEFFATVVHVPVLFVLGNHDAWYDPQEGCGGCICIEDDIFVYKGIRILGLGGSMRYLPKQSGQYSEQEMSWRIRKLWWKIWCRKGFDILVTHAPAKGVNDMEDLPHQGFACFCDLMRKYTPQLFIHGHVHATYGSSFKRLDRFEHTTVVNAYGSYIIEYPEA
ncbi:MAG: metallophosphoesterase [Brotaphodocola sp.]